MDFDRFDLAGLHELRSFGRKRGRKLSPRQETLLSEILPRVRLDLALPARATLDGLPLSVIPGAAERRLSDPESRTPLWLEIGFGGGEHLVWQAEQNPDVQFIGCEPYEDGVVKVLTAIEDKKLASIRLHPDDARPLLRWLPEGSVARAFILFPDPWPKRRHAKRRLVSAQLLSQLASVMSTGGELRIATDIGDYARTTLLGLRSVPHFRWLAGSPEDWRRRSPDWPETRYQSKALREGRRCYFFRFLRL